MASWLFSGSLVYFSPFFGIFNKEKSGNPGRISVGGYETAVKTIATQNLPHDYSCLNQGCQIFLVNFTKTKENCTK
jgi:hypothetical protein